MRPLTKVIATAMLLIGIFAFIKKENNLKKTALSLEGIQVLDMLSNQNFECRPSADYMFYVETDLVEKLRGAHKINAKVYLLERASGKKSLLASENIHISKFEGSVSMNAEPFKQNEHFFDLPNGDRILANAGNGSFSFRELVLYESIYSSYITSTNKLLNLER